MPKLNAKSSCSTKISALQFAKNLSVLKRYAGKCVKKGYPDSAESISKIFLSITIQRIMQFKNVVFATIVAFLMMTAGSMAQNLSTLTTPLETPDGEQQSLAEMGENKVIIVSFGATWCVPCKKEMNAVNDIYDSLQTHGIEYVAVFIDNTKTMAKVGPYVKGKKFEFPVLLDPNQEVFETVNGTEVPYALIYDQNGELKFKHDGYFDGDEMHLLEEAISLTEAESADAGE